MKPERMEKVDFQQPEELEIYLYDGEHVVTDYKLME